jgi:glyceraldehyde-3-phosphate dehydrogenase/erythrose-4-phosphate dehydrogenase
MQQVKKVNLAINGFGRIGRCFLRAALKDSEFMNLVNFNVFL